MSVPVTGGAGRPGAGRTPSAASRLTDVYYAHAWMVPHPTVAHPWMTVAQVCSALLAGGFSALPIQWNGAWCLVHDIDVVAYLRQALEDNGQTQEWERKRLQDVTGTKDQKLPLHPPPLVIRRPEDDVRKLDLSLLRGGLPALVVLWKFR